MSETDTLVTAAHFQYLAERTRGDDPFLRQLKDAARAAGIRPIWIAPEQASFMQILLQLTRAREVVEVGTLDPDHIHTPGIFVHRIFKGERYEKRIERRTVRK